MLLRSLLVVIPAALLISVSDASPVNARVTAKGPPEGIRVTLNCRNEPSGGAIYSLLKEGVYTQQYELFSLGCGQTAEHVASTPDYTVVGVRIGVSVGIVRCAPMDLYEHDRYTCDRATVQVK